MAFLLSSSFSCRSLLTGTRSLATATKVATTSRAPPIPPQTPKLASPSDFLAAIGRQCDMKVSMESWRDFWTAKSPEFKKAGVAVRDRRYILWCMAKYRHGVPIEEFAHEPKPKKTIRGWGPKVQNGKRIRSRRLKSQK